MEHSAKIYYCIVYAIKLNAQHMVPLYEIFIGKSLRFQRRVLAWVLADDHDIYGQHNSSCENLFLSNLVYSLNPYNVCQGIGVGGMVLVFGGVFCFKDYNTAIQISGKK